MILVEGKSDRMLSERTISIIKSTVPVLEVHGTAITKRFYQMMFTNNPELLNVFNHANQKQGRQQTALANAVYAAAANIDQLENIIPVVKQIAHKHRSLGITAEQYPIVGQNLLAAIKDVLGDAATEDIIGAWAEAYGVIAKVFIDVEAGMYRAAESAEGGWSGFRPFIVERKVQESDVITSFYLVPQDGKSLSTFAPGQYITVKLNIPGEQHTHLRQYSLSDKPGQSYYRITVKREEGDGEKPDGKVSHYLHNGVRKGDILELSAPAGDFTLDIADSRPVVLISGGVGLTPMMSMLNTLVELAPERKVHFIHAARNSQVHAMKQTVTEIAEQYPQVTAHWCYSEPTAEDLQQQNFDKEGFVTAEWLQQIVPDIDAAYYFCGPVPFMKQVNKALQELSIAQANIHFEFFGPAGSLEVEAAEVV